MGDGVEIRNLYTFMEIIKIGSFSKTAKKLGYTQSSISAHIQMIEEHYGKELFDRIGNQVKLTQFGLELSRKVDPFLSEYELLKCFDMDQGEIEGTIRIGAPDSLMMYQLYKIIYRYKQKYPKVDIIISNGLCPELRKQVAEGNLDLCMMLQPLNEYPNLIVHTLRREGFSLIFPLGQSEDYVPTEKQMVVIAEEGCTYREVFLHYLDSKGKMTPSFIETGSVEAIKKYVVEGLGVSYIPNYAIEKELEEGSLIAIEYKSDIVFYSQLLYHSKKWLNPALKSLIEMILESY